MNPSVKKYDFADCAKGIAILAIVLYHLVFFRLDVPEIVKTASSFGGAGVKIFLVASGFGLYYSHLNRPLGYGAFLKRRFLKIYLPYIAIVLISFATGIMYTGEDSLQALLSHVFLYKMFIPAYEASFGEQFWYISTLFQLYLIFHLLVWIKNKLGSRKFFLLACGVSLLWTVFTVAAGLAEERIWNSFCLQFLWEFALGMCMAERFRRGRDGVECCRMRCLIPVTAVSLGLFAVSGLWGGPILKAFNDVFSTLAFGGVCILLYKWRLLRPLWRWINSFSYEWYLTHFLVMTVLYRLIPSPHLNFLVGILVLTVGVGISLGISRLLPRFYRKVGL